MDKVRIDKWLWAARFFKTRNLAKQAIEGGKVHCDGQRVKASKDIVMGSIILLRQGWSTKEVLVTALSDKRRGANEAKLLYSETEDSIKKREEYEIQRKNMNVRIETTGRPSKKQRRQIHRFKDCINPNNRINPSDEN